MMRTLGIVFLATLFVFGAAFANGNVVDKDATKEAIRAYMNGDQMTPAQKELAREHIKGWTNRQIDNTGGPDGYGYIFKDSEEADGPVYSWVDNTANGTEFMVANAMGDESEVGPFPIGPAGEMFNFYGVDYDAFWVESNGTIMFTDPGSGFGWSPEALPTDDNFADPPAMFPFWTDFNCSDGGMGYYSYQDVGGTMATVITFVDVPEYGSGGAETATFQAILFQDGTFTYQYGTQVNFDVTYETIGCQAGSAGPALQASFAEDPLAYPYDGLAIHFSVDNNLTFGTVSGTVTDFDTGNPIEGATVTVGGTPYTTDANGAYQTGDMLTGMYDWTASAAGYEGTSGQVDVMEGANTLDVALTAINFDADVLILSLDETVDSEPEITAIIQDMGYTTYVSTDFWEVPSFNDYDYVFLFCGIFPNDFHVSTGTDEEAALIDYYNGGGNLYVEGGDFFGYLPPAGLMDILPVNGDADGGSDLANVVGVAGTFTDGWDMAYAGENSWIDHLSVDGDATLILTNPADDAGTGVVSADFAGFSFEVGMLTDGNGTRYDLISGVFDAFAGGGDPDPVVVTLTPTGDPFVPADGGDINFDVSVMSNMPNLYTGVWFFTTVQLPNGNMYPPNLFQTQFNMPPYFDGGGNLTQSIPAFAPAGFYTMYGTVAGNPNGIGPNFSGSFDFEKGAAAAGIEPVDNWDVSGSLNLAGDADALVSLPAQFELAQVYPNPFNPTANVSVALPTAAELTVAVYNVMGQQVAELASGQMNAGTHNFVLDGSHLSSGIYFVQATVPGELNAVQKVTLMK